MLSLAVDVKVLVEGRRAEQEAMEEAKRGRGSMRRLRTKAQFDEAKQRNIDNYERLKAVIEKSGGTVA